MAVYIENEEMLIDETHDKKIRLALGRIQRAAKEITELGYTLYVSAHGRMNVMNQESYSNNLDYSRECVVSSVSIDKMDAGDW